MTEYDGSIQSLMATRFDKQLFQSMYILSVKDIVSKEVVYIT